MRIGRRNQRLAARPARRWSLRCAEPSPPRHPQSSILYPRFHSGFTLIELMVVIGIIALVAAFLIPSLGSSTGRALDGTTRQFVADLEGARLMAIAERTHTRVLIPNSEIPQLGDNISLRSYLVASLNRTTGNWQQRGNKNRVAQSVAFDPTTGVLDPATTPTPGPTTLGTSVTVVVPYIEFQANGGTSLDPTAPAQVVVLADAFVNSIGTFVPKNASLRSTVTIDPLSGSISVR